MEKEVKMFLYHEFPSRNCEVVVDNRLQFWQTYVQPNTLTSAYSMAAISSDVPSCPVTLQ